jgi:hypothetical protein
MTFESSNILEVKHLTIKNCSQALFVKNSNVTTISESEFINNGNNEIRKGGALHLLKSNVTLINSIFQQNTAIDGAGIYFE